MPSAPLPASVLISGDEAHHALRVKRLTTGDTVLLATGAGSLAQGTIASTRKQSKDAWELTVAVHHVQSVPRPTPSVHVCVCFPKPDLLEHMLDQLSQVGVASVSPLLTARSQPDGRDTKPQRLQRICEESLKQCQRSWLMQLEGPLTFDAALQHAGPLLVADASGIAWPTCVQQWGPRLFASTPEAPARILVGPEGGFTPDELSRARSAGACIVRATPHILRIETAAVVLAGLVLAHASSRASPASGEATTLGP
jgi:16S rRNA (uracil1498-N3)-methyltransferase